MKVALEIRSKAGILHFRRYQLLKTPWFAIYLHYIYRADRDDAMHNHPWNYMSVCLSGSFVEASGENAVTLKTVRPGTISVQNAKRYHKIHALNTKRVCTLFFVGKESPDWGYLVAGKHVPHEEYRTMKNAK